VEARLPQHGIVEQALHENDLFASANLLPCIQPAFTTRQKPMWSHVPDAPSVKIAFQRKDDAMSIGVAPASIHQPCLAQRRD
jgi:hypothetical protein